MFRDIFSIEIHHSYVITPEEGIEIYRETSYHSTILCQVITQKNYNISSITARAFDYMHFNIIMLQNILW